MPQQHCHNCGTQMKPGDTFCQNCGAPVAQQTSNRGDSRKGSGKLTAIIAVVCAAIVLAVAVFFVVSYFRNAEEEESSVSSKIDDDDSKKKDDKKELSAKDYLELGNRYLRDGDYDKAILAFESAIEIDEKLTDAYIGIADAYTAQDDYDKALLWLSRGYEATGDKGLSKKQQTTLAEAEDAAYTPTVAREYLNLLYDRKDAIVYGENSPAFIVIKNICGDYTPELLFVYAENLTKQEIDYGEYMYFGKFVIDVWGFSDNAAKNLLSETIGEFAGAYYMTYFSVFQLTDGELCILDEGTEDGMGGGHVGLRQFEFNDNRYALGSEVKLEYHNYEDDTSDDLLTRYYVDGEVIPADEYLKELDAMADTIEKKLDTAFMTNINYTYLQYDKLWGQLSGSTAITYEEAVAYLAKQAGAAPAESSTPQQPTSTPAQSASAKPAETTTLPPQQPPPQQQQSSSAATAAPLSTEAIDKEVESIRAIWNADRAAESSGAYSSSNLRSGITVVRDAGVTKLIEITKNTDGFPYLRMYLFSEGKLIFAYLEASDAHRLYFLSDRLIRWRYAPAAAKVDEAVDYDNGNELPEYPDLIAFVREEAGRLYAES